MTEAGNPSVDEQVIFFHDGTNCFYNSWYESCDPSFPDYEGVTGADGKVSITIHGYVAGTDTITAVVDSNFDYIADPEELSDSATKQWITVGADSVTLTPQSDTNNTGDLHSVTVKVTDGGANVEGMRVFFQVGGVNYCAYWYGNCLGGDPDQVTNANGEATFTYSSVYSGQDTISVYADTDGNSVPSAGDLTDDATKLWVSRDAASIALNADQLLKMATGITRCVNTNALDASNNPYGNRQVGFRVTGANSVSQNTNADVYGNNTFCYTGANPGTDTITVFADNDTDGIQDPGEPSDTVQQVRVQGPISISLTPEDDTNDVGASHTVTATVTDGNGNPVSDIGVFFEAYGTVYCPHNYGCGDGSQKQTNGSGIATFTYSSNVPGDDAIYAYVDHDGSGYPYYPVDPYDSAAKHWVSDPATDIVLGADQLLKVTTGITRCVTSTATTASGAAYGNRPVGFTVSGVNTDEQIGDADSNGQNTFCYTPTSPAPTP